MLIHYWRKGGSPVNLDSNGKADLLSESQSYGWWLSQERTTNNKTALGRGISDQCCGQIVPSLSSSEVKREPRRWKQNDSRSISTSLKKTQLKEPAQAFTVREDA